MVHNRKMIGDILKKEKEVTDGISKEKFETSE